MLSHSNFALRTADSAASVKDSMIVELCRSNLKNANEQAMGTLYNEYVHRLYTYGMNMCRSHNMVMDCLQDLYAKLWKEQESVPDPQSVKCYLFKSYRLLLVGHIVKNVKSQVPLQENEAFELAPFRDSGIQSEIRVMQTIRLKNGIQCFTKDQREVIYLKFYHGLTYEEIAEITELHIDSVYDLVSKALELISKKVQVSKHPIPVL